MTAQQFGCDGCELGDEGSCVILLDPQFLSLLRWKLSHLTTLAADLSHDLVPALAELLESRGSALHVDKIYSLLQRENPELAIDLSQLRNTLRNNARVFRETNTDVFVLG